MIRRVESLALLLLLSSSALAQGPIPNWIREERLQDWIPYDMAIGTVSDGVCTAQCCQSATQLRSSLVVVEKLDDNGNQAWHEEFEAPGQTFPLGVSLSPCPDGSFWVASQFWNYLGAGFFRVWHIGPNGQVLGAVSHDVDAEEEVLQIRALPDGGLAATWASQGFWFLHTGGDGSIVAEKHFQDWASSSLLGPKGEAYFVTGREARPFEYVVTKLGPDGSFVWQNTTPVQLDWIGDIAGTSLALCGTGLVTTMGAYQDAPQGDLYWMVGQVLRPADGRLLASKDIAQPDRYWVPALISLQSGCLFKETRGSRETFTRVSPLLDAVWSRSIDGFTPRTRADKFGNIWHAGLAYSSPFATYSVSCWFPDSSLRGCHTLNFPSQDSVAWDTSEDQFGRVYSIGSRRNSQGRYGLPTVIVCQYPPLASPVPGP